MSGTGDGANYGVHDIGFSTRLAKATQAQSWIAQEGTPGYQAMVDRFMIAFDEDDLSEADRAFMYRCELEVDAGLSPTWELYHEEDFARADRARDALEEMDDDAETKAAPSIDDDGWVGVG